MKELRTLSDYLTPVIVILLHLYASAAIFWYGSRSAQILLAAELVCFVLLFVLQIHQMKQIWLWAVLLLNLIFVPLSLSKNPADKLAMIYVGLLVSLLLFKQISIPRRVYLASHFLTALLLTYFLTMCRHSVLYLDYYEIFGAHVNPNFFGIIALACMMHWICWFDMLRVKAGYRYLGQAMGAALALPYILESGCRSALLAAAVFLFLLVIRHKPLSPRACQILTLGAFAFMLIFPAVYLRMAPEEGEREVLGKLFFTGRQGVWAEVLPIIRENLLLGNGEAFSSSAHHALFELLLRFGLIPFATFLTLSGRPDRRSGSAFVSRAAQMAFIACLFAGTFESIFTVQYLYVFFLSFLLSAVEKESAGDGS